MAPAPLTITSRMLGFSPMAVHDVHLAKREVRIVNPAAGSKPPQAYNNLWFQLLFAFIGIGMCLTALWFFFRAKNGGFKWRGKADWEDYKSTVLRRKGPDGKTLSNATKSTRLGGGSVVHGGSYGVESSAGYTDETGTSADMSEMREVEEGNGRHHFGIRGGDAEKKKKKRRHEHDNDYKDNDLREYRGERPARVGGLNREADGMYTDYSATGTEPSELGSNVSSRPLVKDKDKAKGKGKDKPIDKKEAKAKEQRAKERMRKAKLAEKEAAKIAAAEAKAQKEAEKLAAKEKKIEQKKAKKAKTEAAPSEVGGPAMTEYTALESEYTAATTEYTAPSVAPARGPSARRAPPSAAYSFTTGDDQTVYTGVYTNDSPTHAAPSAIPESSYYSDYRPNAERSQHRSRSRPRQETRSRPSSQSPRKHHRPSRQSDASDIFTAANGDVRGTIAYPCHIPGLSSAGSVGVSESVSQVGGPREPKRSEQGRGRDVMAGYRRGGVRAVNRRDSLSDSDA